MENENKNENETYQKYLHNKNSLYYNSIDTITNRLLQKILISL